MSKRKNTARMSFGPTKYNKKSKSTSVNQRKLNSAVRRLINEQGNNRVDAAENGDVIDTLNTNAATYITNITQGVGEHKRESSNTYLKSLRIRWSGVYWWKRQLGTEDIWPNHLRVSVIYDRKPTGTIPPWNQVFKGITTGGTAFDDFRNGVSPNEMDRYEVLREEVLAMNPTMWINTGDPIGHAGSTAIERDWFIKLNRRLCAFRTNDVSGTIENCTDGAIYLYMRAGYKNAHSYIKAAIKTRLTFSDF